MANTPESLGSMNSYLSLFTQRANTTSESIGSMFNYFGFYDYSLLRMAKVIDKHKDPTRDVDYPESPPDDEGVITSKLIQGEMRQRMWELYLRDREEERLRKKEEEKQRMERRAYEQRMKRLRSGRVPTVHLKTKLVELDIDYPSDGSVDKKSIEIVDLCCDDATDDAVSVPANEIIDLCLESD